MKLRIYCSNVYEENHPKEVTYTLNMKNANLSVVIYAWNPSTWVVETKRLGVQDHSPLHREFKEASLDYKRHLVLDLGVVTHAFNSSTQEEECGSL